MRSSYIENRYGEILKTFVIALKPLVAVEVGVLDGYSTIHLAAGIKVLREVFGMFSTLESYDLFEDYEYKHGEKEKVQEYLTGYGLDKFVLLKKGCAFEVYKNYEDGSIDLLHFDISNDGKVLEHLMETWHNKIRAGGVILFEGGSPERDEIEWMKKYNKKSIRKVLKENEIINNEYTWVVYPHYPSLTVLFKKGGCSSCELQ
jgi:predicted O-methyltransferase YrrM